MKLKIFFLVMIFSISNGYIKEVQAQFNSSSQQDEESALAEAILQKLTLLHSIHHDIVTYTRHCRTDRFGCEQRIEAIVGYIFEVSSRESVDPWLLAAMAWHESGFNPFAISSAGAVGVLQLLRRSSWSRGIAFVRQTAERNRCKQILGNCQQELIERAVFWLKRSIEYCGSLDGGLRMYNSGKCDGPSRYTRAVLAARRDLYRRSMTIQESSFTSTVPLHHPLNYFQGIVPLTGTAGE